MSGYDVTADAAGPTRAASIPNGCQYVPGYLPSREATRLFEWLLENVSWRTEPVRMFGRTHSAPRLVAWCGDEGLNYRYSGSDHQGQGWPAQLDCLRPRLVREWGCRFNFLLLNRYRSGADRMGWHRDDEPMTSRTIASLSLGATRRFLIRPDPGRPSIPLTLEHGSLLLMDRLLPHALPSTRRQVGQRVNLSFRSLPCST
ncbi:MAG TPA: alpha-ketoglutarate-dependent dioxygenase AlkB [Pseudomonadales bacterium]